MNRPPLDIMPKLAALTAIVLLAGACSGGADIAAIEASASPLVSTTAPRIEPADGPQLSDHWHAAYAVYLCDVFLQPFGSELDPEGIHSHSDALIHIHPFSEAATGSRATMGVFLDAMQVELTGDGMTFPDGSFIENGTDCNGEPAFWQIGYWPELSADPVTFTDDLNAVAFRGDLELFTLAFVPLGADIPQPPLAE